LELGGKSSNIIFADADLDLAIDGVVAGVFAATGQTCVAGSRVVVQREIFEEVAERLCAQARRIRLGDPMDPRTDMGPIAYREQHEHVLASLQLAREEGASVLTGGGPPDRADLRGGLFVAPTVLTGLPSSASVNQEEIFGPVASLIPFSDESEAVTLANDVRYGLACGVWTQNIHTAHRVAQRVRAGTVYINCYRLASAGVPLGGMRESGYGRENGRRGLDEYLVSKSIWVELSGKTRDPFMIG
jgi:aldehyde dehydrogenase (NAD+)